jgi:hypothetical protein
MYRIGKGLLFQPLTVSHLSSIEIVCDKASNVPSPPSPTGKSSIVADGKTCWKLSPRIVAAFFSRKTTFE